MAKGRRFTYKSVLAIAAIFSVSVCIRIPNLNRPLSKHHEFVTAVSLRVLQIWHEDGASNYHYAPVMNYPGEANKDINNHASPTGGMRDDLGNYYYVSHPPFAYMLPHAYFSVFHIKPTVLSLQIFHLIVNFFSGIIVYLIVLQLKQQRARSGLDWTALIATTLYFGSTAVLWFQANTYMSDMLVHVFFLSTVFLALKALRYNRLKRWKVLYAMSLFLMIYTSWLGVFFAFVIALFGMTLWRSKRGVALALISVFVSLLTLVLIVLQYSSIAGYDVFVDQLLQRYIVRGSGDSAERSFFAQKGIELGTIVFNYAVNFLPLLLLIMILFLRNWKEAKNFFKLQRDFILIALLPILLLHLTLLNYSGHDFTVLYASCLFTVTGAFLLDALQSIWKYVLLALTIVTSFGLYYFINPPGEITFIGERYDTSKNFGLFLKENAKPNEIITVYGTDVDPMVVVYAERNIKHEYVNMGSYTGPFDWEKVEFTDVKTGEKRVLLNE